MQGKGSTKETLGLSSACPQRLYLTCPSTLFLCCFPKPFSLGSVFSQIISIPKRDRESFITDRWWTVEMSVPFGVLDFRPKP
jgi:hypothetical protein